MSADEVLARLQDGMHLIPPHMHGAIERYVLLRIQPGGFLTALLGNDLFGAVARADDANQRAIANWAIFLHNYVPRACYGSPEAVRAWLRGEA